MSRSDDLFDVDRHPCSDSHAMLWRLTSRLCIIKENDNKSSWR